MSFLVPRVDQGSPTVGGWSLIPPLLGILFNEWVHEKKTYGLGLPLLLTWEDKDIPEVVALNRWPRSSAFPP